MSSSDNAGYMLSIIQQMARLETNPVLMTLSLFDDFIEQKKYELPAIKSNSIALRIFYHHHSFPGKRAEEHGHYHIFTQENETADWHHLVAVSMDKLGQPVQLSMVNQWVTDSGWVTHEELVSLSRAIEEYDPDSLLHSWFIALLSLLNKDIFELIKQRDAQLSNINETSISDDILKDRAVYLLSHVNIDLQQQLLRLLNL